MICAWGLRLSLLDIALCGSGVLWRSRGRVAERLEQYNPDNRVHIALVNPQDGPSTADDIMPSFRLCWLLRGFYAYSRYFGTMQNMVFRA